MEENATSGSLPFDQQTLTIYGNLLQEAVKDGTPYDVTKTYMVDQFKTFNLTGKETAEITANMMATITAKITSDAMQVALGISDKMLKNPQEVANLAKQGIILDKQSLKLDADIAETTTRKDKMVEQVEHNKIIKAMDAMGDMIGTIGAGGIAVHKDVFKVFFKLNKDLTTQELPANTDMTKL